MVKCHAIGCDQPALPGQPQCYEHWMMLPAKVREARPWVRPVAFAREPAKLEECGQMELFA